MRTTPHPLAFAMASAFLVTLASCGGSDGDDDPVVVPPTPSPITLSGTVVVDQAIQNAVVCLDLNANGACDATEPASAKTSASGDYSLSYDPAVVTAGQAAAASLIAPMVQKCVCRATAPNRAEIAKAMARVEVTRAWKSAEAMRDSRDRAGALLK